MAERLIRSWLETQSCSDRRPVPHCWSLLLRPQIIPGRCLAAVSRAKGSPRSAKGDVGIIDALMNQMGGWLPHSKEGMGVPMSALGRVILPNAQHVSCDPPLVSSALKPWLGSLYFSRAVVLSPFPPRTPGIDRVRSTTSSLHPFTIPCSFQGLHVLLSWLEPMHGGSSTSHLCYPELLRR
jgi:hypothetical protein